LIGRKKDILKLHALESNSAVACKHLALYSVKY